MIKNFTNSSRDLHLNNVQSVNFGYKNHRDAVHQSADVEYNSVMIAEVQHALMDNVPRKNEQRQGQISQQMIFMLKIYLTINFKYIFTKKDYMIIGEKYKKSNIMDFQIIKFGEASFSIEEQQSQQKDFFLECIDKAKINLCDKIWKLHDGIYKSQNWIIIFSRMITSYSQIINFAGNRHELIMKYRITTLRKAVFKQILAIHLNCNFINEFSLFATKLNLNAKVLTFQIFPNDKILIEDISFLVRLQPVKLEQIWMNNSFRLKQQKIHSMFSKKQLKKQQQPLQAQIFIN